ncbi:MAG: pyridoxal phosphate-dependent aminotransferase [Firmicutes bacterium]|nr:pyridoxal phosphate-dependent aminotransferase [Bacillota bacterium]
MKFSSKIQNCGYSPIRKFYPYQVACKKRGVNIVPLNIGQPDIKTPDAYKDVLKNFDIDVLAYAPSPGIPELLEAVKKYYNKVGVPVETSDILVTTGGSEALTIALSCILDDGDELMIPEPFYPNYSTFTNLTGGKIHPIPTSPAENYKYAVREKLESCLTPHTRAMMLTNPGNPTGYVLTQEEMRIIADFVKEHDLFLIADEVYREFVYSDKPLSSFGTFDDIKDNVILIDSVSKRFSACGARIGCMISRNKELVAHAMKICQARLCCATIDQTVATALYGIDFSYFDDVKVEYMKRRDTLYNGLKAIPGVTLSNPEGAFYMMATLPVDDTDKFQQWLLEEFSYEGETVMYAPAAGFYGTPGAGKNEIRCAYVIDCELLEKACMLLGKAIEAYNNRQ